MQQPSIRVTLDEVDISQPALKRARSAAVRHLIASGVQDLNTLTSEQWDEFLMRALLAYHAAYATDVLFGAVVRVGVQVNKADVPY